MALAEPAQFTTEKKKWKYYPIVFVKCPDLLKYWATHTFSALDGITYEPIIKNISAVSCKIDRDGGLATVGNLTIDLSNMEDYADWLASTPNVENNVCEFYLIFNDGTALVFNEAIKFFTGLIEETEIDYDTLSISVSHQDLFLNNYVGGLIAEDVYDLQYPSSVGKFKPIIYGNHTYQGTKPTADFNPDEVPKVVPCIQLSENQYMVAGHELGYFTYTNLWLYNRNLKRFFYVDPDVNEIDISNPDGDGNCTFTVSRNRALTVWDCWFPSGIVQSTYGTAGEFSDEDNIIDKSNSTYGRLNDTFNAGDVTNVQLSFMPYDFSGFTSIMDVQFYSRRDWTAGGTAYWKVKELGYAARKAFVIDAVYDSGPPPFVTITTGQYVNGVVTEAAHGFLVGETVQIGDVFEGYTSLGYVNRVILTVADPTHFTIYHPTDQTWTAGKFTSCKVGSSDEFSIASTTYGYPVYTGDAWLKTKDSLKSSVAVTVNGTGSIDAKLYLFFKRIKMGVHPSSDNILCASCQGIKSGGSYVTNPVSIIKHLATNYGGMAAGDFDSTAFTAAETARSSWVFNPVFLEYRKTKEWIHDLAKACSVFSFWNNGNDLKIVPYTQGASAAYTANVLTISEVAA